MKIISDDVSIDIKEENIMKESMGEEDISKTIIFNENNITTKIDGRGNHIACLCLHYVKFWMRATSLELLLYYNYNSVQFCFKK